MFAVGLLSSTAVEMARASFREPLFLCHVYVLGQPQSPLPAGFSFEDAALQEMVGCSLCKSLMLGEFSPRVTT